MWRIAAIGVATALLGILPAAAQGYGVHDQQRAGGAAFTSAADPLIAPPAACPGQRRLRGPAAIQERAMLCLIDYARQATSATPLAPVGQLEESAAAKSADILRCDQFDHYACGRPFDYWMRAGGYLTEGCWRVGENIAWGRGALGTSRAIFEALIESPSHRENILLPDFADIGVSVRSGELDGMSGVRVWTQHFGLHCD